MRRDKPEHMNVKFAMKHSARHQTPGPGTPQHPCRPPPPTRFDGLVVMARVPHPIPSRTRP